MRHKNKQKTVSTIQEAIKILDTNKGHQVVYVDHNLRSKFSFVNKFDEWVLKIFKR